jgi:hypothetical protein
MMRICAFIGTVLLLGGCGPAGAAPQLEYFVFGTPDEAAGIVGGRRAWEIRDSLGRFFNYRMMANDQATFMYRNEDWVVHNLTVDSRNVSLLLDWHPLAGRFRFSGGLFSYMQDMDYIAAPDIDELLVYEYRLDPQAIVDDLAEELQSRGINVDRAVLEAYLPEDAAPKVLRFSKRIQLDARDLSVHARVRYEDVAPYFGLGWSTPFSSERRLRYSFDIGGFYRSEPDIDVTVYGDSFHDAHPAVHTWLDEWTFKQEHKLGKKLEKNSLNPRLGLGLSYRLYRRRFSTGSPYPDMPAVWGIYTGPGA